MLFRAAAALLILATITHANARAEPCEREAFAAVVDAARAELLAINDANKQIFQSKLALVKNAHGWSDSDYAAKATPFVKDERIAAFDAHSQALLAKVPELKEVSRQTVASLAGAASTSSVVQNERCAMVDSLKALMAQLVENTHAKWAYMLGKLDAAEASAATPTAEK